MWKACPLQGTLDLVDMCSKFQILLAGLDVFGSRHQVQHSLQQGIPYLGRTVPPHNLLRTVLCAIRIESKTAI